MASQKILQKQHSVEGDTVIITETIQKQLNKAELKQEYNRYEMEQERIVAQMKQLKQRYDALEESKKQVLEYINAIPDETLPNIGA